MITGLKVTLYLFLLNVGMSWSLFNWQVADVIYSNGDILTMRGDTPEYV
jgi:tartrate dehydratase beta subunit/fumarate hydratase class I family protein